MPQEQASKGVVRRHNVAKVVGFRLVQRKRVESAQTPPQATLSFDFMTRESEYAQMGKQMIRLEVPIRASH